jgi:hypothetical protein
MASNTRQLGDELKDYMKGLLNNIRKDIDKQFDKWLLRPNGFLARLCDSYEDAIAQQAGVLKEETENEQRAYDRALLVLGVIGCGAMAWLSKALEHHVGPHLFYEYEENVGVMQPTRMLRKIPREVDAAVFGDTGKDLSNLIAGLAGSQFQPVGAGGPPYQPMNGERVLFAATPRDFTRNVYAEVQAQQKQAQDTIDRLIEKINNTTSSFGEGIVKNLQKNPRFNSLRTPDQQQQAGYDLINSGFTVVRQTWGIQWHFYGNDPPKPYWDRVTWEFEKQLWAVWVLQQHFRLGLRAVVAENGPRPGVIGATGQVLYPTGGALSWVTDSPITMRLYELNAPVKQILDREVGTQAQVDLLNNWATNLQPLWLRVFLNGVPRTLQPVNQMF